MERESKQDTIREVDQKKLRPPYVPPQLLTFEPLTGGEGQQPLCSTGASDLPDALGEPNIK